MSVRSRIVRDEAVVVRNLDYGESDRIIGLVTANHGKLSTFAAAARKSTRRFGGALDLFAHIDVELRPSTKNQGGLWRLSRIEPKNLFFPMRSHLGRLAIAGYLAECSWALAGEGDPHPDLFSWWLSTLQRLSAAEDPTQLIPKLDLELLTLCGYGPRWNVCFRCEGTPNGERMFFSFDRGGICCQGCRPAGEGKWLEASVVRSLSAGEAIAVSGGRSARQAIDSFVSFTLGRQPKSQPFREEILGGSA